MVQFGLGVCVGTTSVVMTRDMLTVMTRDVVSVMTRDVLSVMDIVGASLVILEALAATEEAFKATEVGKAFTVDGLAPKSSNMALEDDGKTLAELELVGAGLGLGHTVVQPSSPV